jgi:hypothetical protein
MNIMAKNDIWFCNMDFHSFQNKDEDDEYDEYEDEEEKGPALELSFDLWLCYFFGKK